MRPDDPDPAAVRALVERLVGPARSWVIERVAEGVSTCVYRLDHGAVTLYLRILPEPEASFGPEALALRLLRERGVRVPEVVAFEPYDERLGRSAMVTTAIAGESVEQSPVDGATRWVLTEAGRQLALLNGLPVAGFGWVRRDQPAPTRLTAEHPTQRAFVEEHLDADLAALDGSLLTRREVEAIRALVADHTAWLDTEPAGLAHGDFDVTAIFQQAGRYTGLIDFGEIRGADRWYDLGHFRMHDGERLPALALDWLVEGYAEVWPLPPDARQRIGFASLLIAVRALGRHLPLGRPEPHRHPGLVAIRRDLALLHH